MPGPANASVYFVVDDVDELYALHKKIGVTYPLPLRSSPGVCVSTGYLTPNGYTRVTEKS